MTGYLAHHAHHEHLDELHRRAAEARRADGARGRPARRPLLAALRQAPSRRRGARSARPVAERA